MNQTIEQQVIETIRILPEEKQKEVLRYAREMSVEVRETVSSKRDSCFGMDAGKIWIADDFDELPRDIMTAFYGEDDENSD